MHLKEQSDYKIKCLNLKNLCSMSFWDLERIDEKIQWIRSYERKGLYSKEKTTIIFAQNNQNESIHLMNESIHIPKRQVWKEE